MALFLSCAIAGSSPRRDVIRWNWTSGAVATAVSKLSAAPPSIDSRRRNRRHANTALAIRTGTSSHAQRVRAKRSASSVPPQVVPVAIITAVSSDPAIAPLNSVPASAPSVLTQPLMV